MSNLENKLNKAREGWSYLWNLLEKEAVRDKVKTGVLAVLYKYQVELYSTKYKLDFIEKKIITYPGPDLRSDPRLTH